MPKYPLVVGRYLCSKAAEGPKIVYVVLPFSRRWIGITDKVRNLCQQYSSDLRACGLHVEVRVSFRKGSIPLAKLVENSRVGR